MVISNQQKLAERYAHSLNLQNVKSPRIWRLTFHSIQQSGQTELVTDLDQTSSKEFLQLVLSNKDKEIDLPRSKICNVSGGQVIDNEIFVPVGQTYDHEHADPGGQANDSENSNRAFEDSDHYSDVGSDADSAGMLYIIPLNRLYLESFTCIFSMAVPNSPFNPILLRSGRPMVTLTHIADIRLSTIVATYHPPTNEFYMEVTDFVGIPRGFHTSQLVDLIGIQEAGYIPAYHCRESQITPELLEWSLCTISADGMDFLFASDTDILIHRIVTAMVNSVEKMLGLREEGNQAQLEGIPDGCFEESYVQALIRIPDMVEEEVKATVKLDYATADMDWDWVPVAMTGEPVVRMSHSERTMWMKAETEE
ncbi:hypothetical protein RUND412_006119 [Rhizina undulata]